MPPNRMESTARAEEAAATMAASAPAPGGMKAWLPLIITILVMPALAYAMTSFVLLPRLQEGLGITAPAGSNGSDNKTVGKKDMVMLSKLLVNVAGTMGSRYLLVSVALEGNGSDFKTEIQNVEPQLRDMACGALATKTLPDLQKPGIRNLIRSELLSGFNNILGGPVVKDIYFTEFAIQ